MIHYNYNLHELAYDLSGFVHTIRIFPDLVVVCGLQALSNEPSTYGRVTTTTAFILRYYIQTW